MLKVAMHWHSTKLTPRLGRVSIGPRTTGEGARLSAVNDTNNNA